jgi:protein SCO1
MIAGYEAHFAVLMLGREPTGPLRVRVAVWIAALGACIAMQPTAQAALSSSQLEQVALTPRMDARLQLEIRMSDLNDRSALLQDWLGGAPTVWVLADYTWETYAARRSRLCRTH